MVISVCAIHFFIHISARVQNGTIYWRLCQPGWGFEHGLRRRPICFSGRGQLPVKSEGTKPGASEFTINIERTGPVCERSGQEEHWTRRGADGNKAEANIPGRHYISTIQCYVMKLVLAEPPPEMVGFISARYHSPAPQASLRGSLRIPSSIS